MSLQKLTGPCDLTHVIISPSFPWPGLPYHNIPQAHSLVMVKSFSIVTFSGSLLWQCNLKHIISLLLVIACLISLHSM